MATSVNGKGSNANILDHCLEGNFEKTLLYIRKNVKGSINSKIAIKLFVCCCNACVHHKDTVSEEYLYEILNSLLPLINNLEEKDILSYVQCVYHFIKFLHFKGKMEIIVKMEDIIIPKFLPPELSQKPIGIYHNTATFLHNAVISISNSAVKSNTICNEILHKICLLMLRICTTYLSMSQTVDLSLSCFKSLTSMKVPVDNLIDFCNILINYLLKNSVENGKHITKLVLHFPFGIMYLILSTNDFEKAKNFIADIENQLKDVNNNSDCLNLLQVLKMFLIYSNKPTENQYSETNSCTEALRLLRNKFKCEKDFIHYLGKCLSTSLDYYLKVNTDGWRLLSENMQLQYFKFICEYDLLLVSAENREDKWIYTYNGLCYVPSILQLIRHTIRSSESSLKYHQTCIELLKTFLNQIEVLKHHNVDYWKKVWDSIVINIYNVGIGLHKHSNQAAIYYLYLIIKYSVVLEVNSELSEANYTALESTFTAVINILDNESNIKRQLGFISLGIFLCKNNRDYFMAKWITLKHSLRDKLENKEEMQSINLVSALEAIQKELPDLKLEESDKIFLLTFELKWYKKKWRSTIPMLSAIKDLRVISSNEYFATSIVKLFVDIGLLKHTELHTIVEDVLDTFKSRNNGSITSEVTLAILYFLYYKSCSNQIVMKNAKEMERVAAVEPLRSDLDPTDPQNPNEECDILSSYESLNLEVFKIHFRNLEHSIAVFNSVVPKLTTDLEHVTLLQLFNVLLDISFEFRLVCFKMKCVQTLELALQIAQVLNDVPNIIKTIGFIIDQTDTRHHLIDVADKLIDGKSFSKLDNLEISVTYYICKSRALLHTDINESYDIFVKAKELFGHVKDNNGFAIIKSRLLLLNSKFSMLPCNLGLETHEKSLIMNTSSAVEVVSEEYKNIGCDNTYNLLMLIEAIKELVELYHYLKCPREVTSYGKDILLLTQKLVLPLETVTYLLYLAHADLRLDNQDSCCVKVKDITSILNFKHNTDGKKFYRMHSSSSPSMAVASYEGPCAMQHETNCDCYYCACYEYQYLVLEKVRLSALINVKEKNLEAAQDFFQGALDLYNYYVKKYSQKRQLPPDFLPSYGYVLLNYSSHLWRTNKKVEAFDWNRTLLSILDTKKLQYLHLYNEALVQKLGYITENIIPEPYPALEEQMERLQISEEVEPSRTPENKRSTVFVFIDPPKFDSPQKHKVKKCVPFTFASPEPPQTNNKPVKVMEKTPPPKVQIYTETSDRKVKRKPVASKPQVSSVLLPSTGNVPESNTSVNSALKSRTKLLTAKLKQTSKKTEGIGNIENQEVSVVSTRSQVRKNLLKELSTPSSDTKSRNTGTVRRTRKQ